MKAVQQHFDLVEKTMDSKGHFAKILSEVSSKFEPYFNSKSNVLFNENCMNVLKLIPENSINMIFADPPYMLSNDGFSCQNGKRVNVNKGKWDKSKGFDLDLEFHNNWISLCRKILKPEGTIWISGTYHSIYQCGYLLQKNNFHILNDITWFKPNASPNLSCRFFTASHETIIWARKEKIKTYVQL
jgi:site-specific DNA-methyltransferase (adenine-specific)